MPVLTDPEIAQFLAEPGHLARIATVDSEGIPLVVPVWFIFEEGKIFITPRERSEWWKHIQGHRYVCIVIDEEAQPWRKVMVRGSVEIVHGIGHDDEWRDQYRRIACRYVGEPEADAYLANTHDEPRALIAMSVENAKTWRMPVRGEDPRQVWAKRYYHTPT
jgi:nitroimidazol reductase NimA-like FMN-containing flavoprotein (pyridoxamine 5'-phosphate oxidase superfamily)